MDRFLIAATGQTEDAAARLDTEISDALRLLSGSATVTLGVASANSPLTEASLHGFEDYDRYSLVRLPGPAGFQSLQATDSTDFLTVLSKLRLELLDDDGYYHRPAQCRRLTRYALAALLGRGVVVSGLVRPGHEAAAKAVLRGIGRDGYATWLRSPGGVMRPGRGSKAGRTALDGVFPLLGLDKTAVRTLVDTVWRSDPNEGSSGPEVDTPPPDPFSDHLFFGKMSRVDLPFSVGPPTVPGFLTGFKSGKTLLGLEVLFAGRDTPEAGATAAAPPDSGPPAIPSPSDEPPAAPSPLAETTVQRHVHLIMEDADQDRLLAPEEGLAAEGAYRLQVGLELLRDPLQAGEDRPLSRLYGEDATFQVAVISRSLALLVFSDGVSQLTWAADDTVTPARFGFHALGPGVATFDVLIHQDCNLLLMATVRAEIAGPEGGWTSKVPIGWQDRLDDPTYRKTRPFSRYARLRRGPDRRACIAVQHNPADGPDSYLVTVLVRTAQLPVRAVFSRGELDSNWTNLRGILDRLRRDPLTLDGGFDKDGQYTGSYAPEADCFHKKGEAAGPLISKTRLADWRNGYLLDLAIAGASLRSNLFRTAAHQSVLDALRNETQEDGSVVQVWLEDRAQNFVYPWHFLYDGSVDPDVRQEQAVDIRKFWGYRLEIEQVTDRLDAEPGGSADGVLDVERQMRVRAGSYPFMQARANLQYLSELGREAGGRLDCQVWTQSRDWKAFLPQCDAHLLYFYTHGHTAAPNSQAGQDLRRLSQDVWAALQASTGTPAGPPGAPAIQTEEVQAALGRLREAFQFLDVERLWDEPHIRLAAGHLLMSDLRTLKLKGPARPLVILNMCESAQVSSSVTDGMVSVFLAGGAVGVIGTEVSIPPQFGDAFGRRLLGGLAAGRRISRVLFESRREFLDNGNLLGFVYTYYGDASARITPPLTNADAVA